MRVAALLLARGYAIASGAVWLLAAWRAPAAVDNPGLERRREKGRPASVGHKHKGLARHTRTGRRGSGGTHVTHTQA